MRMRITIVITFSPATYIVQDIIITILPYELSVECVFAMGSIQYTSCTVILVLDDIRASVDALSRDGTDIGYARRCAEP